MKINGTKFFVRNFGPVPYFDIETGQRTDLRALLDSAVRAPGISGFMRVKNEEQFVEMAIETVVGSLDELVIVHNGCTDRTPDIIESCRQRHPGVIRVFEYKPRVAPPFSLEHQSLPMDSPHSLVNYYNYALARTSRKIAIKVDADELFLPGLFSSLADEVRGGLRALPVAVSGVNLCDHGGEIQVNANSPIKPGIDKGFFRVSPKTFFVHYRHYELFTYAFDHSAGIAYYHLKGMKPNRGYDNYVMDPGKASISARLAARRLAPAVMPWSELKDIVDGSAVLPEPSELGLEAAPGG